MNRRHFLDNRVPPLGVAVVVALCMRAALFASPELHLAWPGSVFLADALAVLGGLVAAVGVTLVLLGYAAFLAHPLALLVVVVFPAYIQAFQIAPEERALDRLFGEAYARYKEGVPRWL